MLENKKPNVGFVIKASHWKVGWEHTLKYMTERNLINVWFVTEKFQQKEAWNHIFNQCMADRNQASAFFVILFVFKIQYKKVLNQFMKERKKPQKC